ncbi:hypothetical protein [Castellaniella sp.]|uniref:hypothetical protein n=1 Tax=Castellaniella sp. TaxID=1955812 RepID=UPI002AFF8A61|nr:hypothetical protein [Castellaniella sp.]
MKSEAEKTKHDKTDSFLNQNTVNFNTETDEDSTGPRQIQDAQQTNPAQELGKQQKKQAQGLFLVRRGI